MAPKENTEIILKGDLIINYLDNTDRHEIKDINKACSSTKYLAAKIFNDLPVEARKHCKEKNFNSILKNYFYV